MEPTPAPVGDGPVARPRRPLPVLALVPTLVLAGLGSLGLGIFFLVAPYFFATKDGGFNLPYFLGGLVFFGLFAILFLVFAGSLVLNGLRLWDGDDGCDEDVRGIGRIAGGLFLFLLAMGITNQPSIGPEDVTAIVALSVPTVLLLGSAAIVQLPSVERYVAESERANARARELAAASAPPPEAAAD